MAITLPLPVRVAAGIVATGLQLVRSLPEDLPAIPVALVGNAMRLSMKVQQEITALATRGDELLGGLVGGRPQETPGWATFDEDTEPARPRPRPVPGTPVTERPAPEQPAGRRPAAPAAPAAAAAPAAPATPAAPAAPATPHRHEPEASSLPDSDTTAQRAAEEVDEKIIELATHAAPPVDEQPAPTEPAPAGNEAGPAAADPAPDAAEPADADDPAADGPPALPGYDGMTLAQVRGHLRELTADDVTELLAYEQSGDNRAPFLTLLSNRLVTLGAQES